MTRFITIAATAAALALPNISVAQSRPVTFGVSGGASIPTTNLSNSVDLGYSLAGHLYLHPAPMGQLYLRGDVSYDRWNGKNSSNSHISSLGVVGNILVPFAPDMTVARPYFLAGAGLYRLDASVTAVGSTVTLSSNSNNFGIQVGGGFEFKLSELSTFLEAKYVNVRNNGNNSGYVPITFGVRF